jgi:hypothetical protein
MLYAIWLFRNNAGRTDIQIDVKGTGGSVRRFEFLFRKEKTRSHAAPGGNELMKG